MKTSFSIIGTLGVGLSLLAAVSFPQMGVAQRFSHPSGGSGGGGGFHPAPAPAYHPAPAENRPAPAVVNRPAPPPPRPVVVPQGTINGGGRNVGNHDFGRAGSAPPPPRVVNARINANVNVYHTNARVAYRPYAFHPYHPYRWGPSWHPLGFFLSSLAADAFYFSVAGSPYYYDDGVYYQQANGGYDVVAAPIGALVAALPPGYETFQLGDDTYFYYGGSFYINTGQGYQVVQAPPGAVVSEVPDGATEQDIDGQTYLLYNGTYFQPVSQDGQDAYQVVQMNQ